MLATPPPPRQAELPLTVQLISVAAPKAVVQAAAKAGGVAADGAVRQRGRAIVVQATAAPSAAELPLTVQFVSVIVPPK